MNSAQQDVIDLLDYASHRLTVRMADLGDAEWAWQAIPENTDVTIRWRIDHIIEMLTESRNRDWLGLGPSRHFAPHAAESAGEALANLDGAVKAFAATARELGDNAAAPIGAAAGPFGEATRRSFVLHVIDELIHHAAEAALLRDLYAAR